MTAALVILSGASAALTAVTHLRLRRHERLPHALQCNHTGPYSGMPCVELPGHGGSHHRNARGWTWIRAQ